MTFVFAMTNCQAKIIPINDAVEIHTVEDFSAVPEEMVSPLEKEYSRKSESEIKKEAPVESETSIKAPFV